MAPVTITDVRRRVRRLSDAHGLRTVPGVLEDLDGRFGMDHVLLPSLRTVGWRPDEADLDTRLQATVRHLARLQMRDDALGGSSRDRTPPAWARIAHPLTVLSARLHPEGTRAVTSLHGDLMTGSCTVARDPVHVAVAVDGRSPSLVTLSMTVPETVAAMCAGRPLHDLVELPRCGDDRIDGAVHALRCARATRKGEGVDPDGAGPQRLIVTLDRTRWIVPELPPSGRATPWNDIHPHHA